MRKDFSNISFQGQINSKDKISNSEFTTAEQIIVKSHYNLNDTKTFEHLNFGAGKAPFLRGPYSIDSALW